MGTLPAEGWASCPTQSQMGAIKCSMERRARSDLSFIYFF